jgi:hypothetical protein
MVTKNMSENANPLKRFFRQPAIYIKLPSGGQHWAPGSLDMPQNMELPVYPMTAMDEITYRTADALFNGSAVVNVIQSCVPAIRNAWHIPSIDVDTILVGIRIASYGHEMQFDSDCVHCQHENTFGLDLRTVMDSIQSPDYTLTVKTGDLELYFKPLDYEQVNRNAMIQFEDQKLLEMLPSSEMPDDEKVQRLNAAFLKLTDMTMNALAQSVSMIRAGTDIVTDPTHIEEFVKNCDREVFEQIRKHIVTLKEQSELKPLKIRCQNPECQKEYETPFTLDVSNFFASAS